MLFGMSRLWTPDSSQSREVMRGGELSKESNTWNFPENCRSV